MNDNEIDQTRGAREAADALFIFKTLPVKAVKRYIKLFHNNPESVIDLLISKQLAYLSGPDFLSECRGLKISYKAVSCFYTMLNIAGDKPFYVGIPEDPSFDYAMIKHYVRFAEVDELQSDSFDRYVSLERYGFKEDENEDRNFLLQRNASLELYNLMYFNDGGVEKSLFYKNTKNCSEGRAMPVYIFQNMPTDTFFIRNEDGSYLLTPGREYITAKVKASDLDAEVEIKRYDGNDNELQ